MREIDFNERREDIDNECVIADSELCHWMAAKTGCANCYIHNLKTDEQRQDSLEKWKETLNLVPDGLTQLHNTDECQFCKGKIKKADGYANIEMAHAEPYYEKGMFFGIGKKVRTPVGSLLPVQAAVCADCRRKIIFVDYTPLIFLLLFLAIAVIILMLPNMAQNLANIMELLPVLFILGMIGAGYLFGKAMHKLYAKKVSTEVKIDACEIPLIKQMIDEGWFFFQTNDDIAKISFSKHKLYDRIKDKDREERTIDIPLDNMNI